MKWETNLGRIGLAEYSIIYYIYLTHRVVPVTNTWVESIVIGTYMLFDAILNCSYRKDVCVYYTCRTFVIY